MARKYLRVSMPVLLSGTCSENFHKTNENSDCINETFDYVVDNLPGRHLGYGKLTRGSHQIRIAESVSNPSHQIQFLRVETDF